MAEYHKKQHAELGSIYVPKTIAQILIDVSMIDDLSRKLLILEFHVQALEEEMRRIDAFKRQLPHCMHFVEDVEIMKQEMLRCKRRGKCPVVEEFMPLKSDFEGSSGAKESNDVDEKKEWMSSVQLWTTPVHYDKNLGTKHQHTIFHQSRYQGDQGSRSGSNSGSGGNLKHMGGAFTPFRKDVMKNKGVGSSGAEVIELNATGKHPQLQEPYPQQPQKKQRRCWSPELHKQFVDALQQLGGVDMATPKQIREVMQVEGLTNDEVKSHLQKYRLHIRKLPPPSAGQLNLSWLARDDQRDNIVPVPMVTYSDTSQNPNPQAAAVGGSGQRGSSKAGGSHAK